MRIQLDYLTGPDIAALLQEHLNEMNAVSRPKSKHVLDLAALKSQGYQLLYLETGAMDYFAPTRALYRCFGFELCGLFAQYKENPNSVFMYLQL
ncbi:hypothetical protein WH43_09835 [Rheinheimera sp. KL1]|jgi:putative acetyltransferase|uniref:hypothetical protein n=1 Tax=Rheinheimera sp. KL1 TaxID=1635005 RepID=UPI0006A9D537|nr:hypothetical protein [Rheinheimera sp. KL1]KOO58097.1 hypothetical protein WH43_09835 [Rheinheimera sp. KL1]